MSYPRLDFRRSLVSGLPPPPPPHLTQSQLQSTAAAFAITLGYDGPLGSYAEFTYLTLGYRAEKIWREMTCYVKTGILGEKKLKAMR